MSRQLLSGFLLFPLLFFLSACKGRFFRASSGSMEATIMVGEKFYVTETDKFERNDIVVFNYYGNDYQSPRDENGNFSQHWEKRVFRLIALSGDSLNITGGDVFVNGKYLPMSETAITDYEIHSVGHIAELDTMDPEKGRMVMKVDDTIVYQATLTTQETEEYKERNRSITKLRKRQDDVILQDTLYAKTSAAGRWSSDNYGPLRIPGPGDAILVDPINYKFYHNIPGVEMGKNIVKEKLYFLMGENRHMAEDSRFIGLISHSNMYGVVK
jgi:signal peptidase I